MQSNTEHVPLRIVILGLSITSSWGNGHATTYRGLVRELAARGHDVLFLEREVPWYAENRDLPAPSHGHIELYSGLDELRDRFDRDVRDADIVIVGSYVPQGIAVGEWVVETAGGVRAFYDIDTPVTLARLESNDIEYLSLDLIQRYDLYLSFTGGPILRTIEERYGARMVRALYCSVDPGIYYPEHQRVKWDLGYLGTYSRDRQPPLEHLMIRAADRWSDGRFVVGGPQYPSGIRWPPNVERIDHVPPCRHREFYNSQRLTLNITRTDMIRAGYSPSVRLFEAAACGTPIISDAWQGLEAFFEPGREILITHSPEETLRYLREIPEEERIALGKRARDRALSEHTAAHRAVELENHAAAVLNAQATRSHSTSRLYRTSR